MKPEASYKHVERAQDRAIRLRFSSIKLGSQFFCAWVLSYYIANVEMTGENYPD